MIKDIDRAGLAAGLAILIALAVSGTVAAEERSFTLSITGGRLAITDKTIRVGEGDNVVLRWRSDTAGEIHLHGYDLAHELAVGKETRLRFEAFAAGRFPFTLHGEGGGHGHGALGYLEVMPR